MAAASLWTGVLAALYFTGGTLSIYSQIGLVTLVGLITKHGILIVEFATQLREEGEAIRDSMLAASGQVNPAMYGPGVNVYFDNKTEGGEG